MITTKTAESVKLAVIVTALIAVTMTGLMILSTGSVMAQVDDPAVEAEAEPEPEAEAEPEAEQDEQEQDEQEQDEQEQDEQEQDEQEQDEPEEIINQFSDGGELVDIGATDDRVRLVLRAEPDQPTTFSVAEPVSQTGSFEFSTYRLRPGETREIRFPTDKRAVTVTTPQDGYYWEGDRGSDLPSATLPQGVGIGIATMSLGMGIAVWRKTSIDFAEVQSGWK